MDLLLQLLGLVVTLAAIAPVGMSGGQMIAAFMVGQRMLVWVGLTVACMLALAAGGMLALHLVADASGGSTGLMLAAGAVFLAPVWLAYWAGSHWIGKR